MEVVGLLTTFNESADRVAMHAVRRELVEAQASAAGLPLLSVWLPSPCPNEAYEAAMRDVLNRAISELAITAVAFGDLFLEDVRAYREEKMADCGLEPLFPLWGSPTVLEALPESVDPCGERGEFHTFAFQGPMFSNAISVGVGEVVERDGFIFADLVPNGAKKI